MPGNEDLQDMRRIHARGDRSMFGMLVFHAAAALCFGCFYDTWLATFVIGGAALGMYSLAWWLQPGTFLTRCVAGIALQCYVALHIYQLHGLAEMHFFFFTAFAAMLVYQDWLCMWPGALLIIAQHVLFAILHNGGTNVFFFEADYVSFTKLGFHFGIALLHVGLCNLCAIQLRNQTLRDARIRRDLELAQSAAERASAAKTMFLGDMSHELRTPMSGVLGMTEILLRQPLPRELRESLEVVHTSALAMVDIVNDSLDLARIEAGKLDIAEATMDLRRICEEVAELLGPRAQAAGVELVVRWQPGSPHEVRGDAGRWRQVLTNLTGNAIKFADGGHVLIDAGVEPAAPGVRTRVRVRIDDSGKGIPPDVLPKLFQRFEQGGASTFGKHGGSGLGLAISRELVTRMHGNLSVHSVLGAGSTFVIDAELVVEAAATPPPACPHRVLLVGEHELTLGVLAEQLEAMGADVVVTHAAAAARTALAAGLAEDRPFQMLMTEPALLTQLEDAADVRLIALGPAGDRNVERIVWLQRHRDLEQLVASAPSNDMPDDTPQPALGLRVLLAEDDAICATVASRMLRMLGCECTHVVDGAAAVERCRNEQFDVVLMDCRMPVLEGLEATRRIRAAEPPGRRQPIVMLSANSLASDRQECLQAGADAFLGKPVRLPELRAALLQWPPSRRTAALSAEP